MQYRHEIGHALANFAFVMKGCNYLRNKLQCSIGMKSGTLSLTSPSQRILSEKLRYLCFSQVPAGSDCPLSCLYCICRFNSLIVTVLLFAGLLVPAGSDCPLPCLYCSCRFNSLIVTVLNSTGFQQVTGSDCPSYRPIIHQSLHLIGFYSSSLRKFASTGGLRLPSFMPILHLLLQFTNCYCPSLRRFLQVSGSDYPPSRPTARGKYITLIYIPLYFHDLWNADKRCLY